MGKSEVQPLRNLVVDLTGKEPIQVLHVDDEVGFLKTAKQILEMEGSFQVETAASVQEAREKMKEKTIDAIICDYQMPERNGLEFLKELRDNGNTIPFIIFTGKARKEMAIKALNLGADQYLSKAGDPETVYGELEHSIRRAVERNRAYIKLWQREERLRAIFASSPDAIIISDLQGKIIDCNKAAWKPAGYSSKEELVGKSSFDFVAEKDRERALKNLKETFKRGVTKKREYSLLKKDGKEYTGELSSSIIKDSFGEPYGFVGILRDVTERKKAEEGLRESEEKYRSLFENARDVTLIYDLKGNITAVNKTAIEYGLRKDDIINKNILKFIPQKYWSKIRKELVLNTQGKTTEGKIEIYTPEGKKLAEYRSNPIIIDNKVVGVQTVLKDITERKKAETREKVYAAGIENAHEGIVFTRMDGDVLYFNKAACKIFGYTAAEMKKMNISQFSATTADRKKLEKAVREKGGFYGEIRGVRKNGETFPGMLSVSIVKDDRGRPIGRMGVFKDITERKQAEEALRESQQKFERVFKDNPEAAVYLDPDFNILDVNPRFTEVFGYAIDEVKGKHIDEIVVPRDKMEEAEMLNTKAEKGYVYHDTVRKRKDGSLVPVSISAAPVTVEGEIIGTVALYKDITEREQFEERLSALNIYSRELNTAESMEAIYRLTLDAMEKTLGFDYAFFMVVDKDMLCVVDHRGYSADISVKLPLDGSKRGVSVKVARTGKPMYIPDAEKEEDWVVFSPGIRSGLDVPVKIGSKVLGVIGVDSKELDAFHQKDQKLLEILASHAATAISNLEYAKSLEIHAQKIEQSREKLKMANEKLHVVGKLTRHDIRNRLSAITGNVYLAEQQLKKNDESMEYLREVKSAVKQATRIFDFARTYEKLGVEELEYVDVEENVKEAVQIFSDLPAEVKNECDGLTVLADSLLSRLFYNLIHNSLEHGGKVNQIRVYYEEAGKDSLKLMYKDDGIGIPEGEKEQIFQEGYGKGTGYGLYLIRKICEVYGWTIRETGKQGKGAQFTITIPKLNINGEATYQLT